MQLLPLAAALALLCAPAGALPTPKTPLRYDMFDLGGGVTIGALMAGSTAPKSVVLLTHGWPEGSYLWRGVIDPLLNGTTDRLLIMPDQRGYNRSYSPKDIMAYNLTADLVPDMVGLVGKIVPAGVKIDVVGHDWGGPVAWAFASMHPELTRTLTILNGPHPTVFNDLLHTDPVQQKDSAYMFTFDGKLATTELNKDTIGLMYGGASWYDAATKAAMKDAWGVAGSFGGLAWYRCNIFGGDLGVKAFSDSYPVPSMSRVFNIDAGIKTLVLWAMGDTAFDNEKNLKEHAKYVPTLETKRYPGVSHWIAQEKPAEVGADIYAHIA